MFGFIKRLLGGGNDAQLGEWLQNGAIIIDVRTPGEYRGGHAPKSINIPLDQVQGQIKKIKAYNKPVITCCASGNRSGAAASILRGAGIEVVNGGPWQVVDSAAKAQAAAK